MNTKCSFGYCKTVNPSFLANLNKQKPTTMAQLADIWYGTQNADYGRNQHYNDSRYHMLNLHATFTKGTVEFRLFQFDAPSNGKQNGAFCAKRIMRSQRGNSKATFSFASNSEVFAGRFPKWQRKSRPQALSPSRPKTPSTL